MTKKKAAKKKAAPAEPQAEKPGGAKKPEYPMPTVVQVTADDVKFSSVNPNKEDSSTFAALKKMLERHGLLELPVVQRRDDGYVCVSGEHRLTAMFEEYERVPVLIAPKQYEKEDELSVVANMNLVRGKVTVSALRDVVMDHDLDPSKLDLHGVPPWMLGEEDKKAYEKQKERKAHELEVKKLAMEIARGLAVQILEERDDDGLLVADAQGKAVIMTGFRGNAAWLRDHRPEVKAAMRSALKELEGWEPGRYAEVLESDEDEEEQEPDAEAPEPEEDDEDPAEGQSNEGDEDEAPDEDGK